MCVFSGAKRQKRPLLVFEGFDRLLARTSGAIPAIAKLETRQLRRCEQERSSIHRSSRHLVDEEGERILG